MQSITFNNAIQGNSAQTFVSVSDWLDARYTTGVKIIPTTYIHSLITLQNAIQYTFKDHKLFLQALTHTSFTNEEAFEFAPSNERLEFLGDSVVNLIITSHLYKQYPDFKEGELSRLRGALVNETIFSKLAMLINLSENMFIGKGEWGQKKLVKVSMLADAFEALLGAIFLEAGIAQTEQSFLKILETYKQTTKKDFFSAEVLIDFDSKTKLQEICMSLYSEHPQYISHEVAEGFSVGVWLKNTCLITATGKSKKKLEKELAKIVLTEKKYLI